MSQDTQRYHEKALADGLLTATQLAGIESTLSTRIMGDTRTNALDVKSWLFVHGPDTRTTPDKQVSRLAIRDCGQLHRNRPGDKGNGPVTIIDSRLAVLTKASGLVDRTHQNADKNLATPASQFTAADLGLSVEEWLWICIPGKPNPFAAQTPQAASVAVSQPPPTSTTVTNQGLPASTANILRRSSRLQVYKVTKNTGGVGVKHGVSRENQRSLKTLTFGGSGGDKVVTGKGHDMDENGTAIDRVAAELGLEDSVQVGDNAQDFGHSALALEESVPPTSEENFNDFVDALFMGFDVQGLQAMPVIAQQTVFPHTLDPVHASGRLLADLEPNSRTEPLPTTDESVDTEGSGSENDEAYEGLFDSLVDVD